MTRSKHSRALALMPLETPPLRVSRPVAACQRCRSAKIRCDGKLPACSACEKSGRAKECSSANTQFAPGKERSYVATLEAKVERLEKRIAEARRRRESTLSMLDVASPAVSARRPDFDPLKSRKAQMRSEEHTIDELVSDFGFLTVNANARDYTTRYTSISYARLILSAAEKEPMPSGMRKELPPRGALLPLIRLYTEKLLPLVPVLEESDVYRSLDMMSDTVNYSPTAMDHWTITMILAIASASLSRQRGDAYYTDAVGYTCSALEVSDYVLHPGSIYSIQAMLLLVQYSMLDPAHFDSWTLIGAASRAMVDLGLNVDPSKSSNTPRWKLELRRRVYHCVYALDRSTSIVQTRAFSFSDDSATVGLPFTRKPTSPSINSPKPTIWARSSGLTLAFLAFRQMQSRWYNDLFQSGRTPWAHPYDYIWQAYQEMSEWFQELPATISPQTREFLELDLLYSYVYILSPSPRCPAPSEHAQRLIVEHCTNYAKMVQRILAEPMVPYKISPFTFYDALRAYMMARDFVDALSSNLDTLLRPPTGGPSYSPHSSRDNDSSDPLAPLTPAAHPPPLPPPSSHDLPADPVARALDVIDTFLVILSAFGVRFGSISSGVGWRDKFQQEAQPLVTQLHARLQAANPYFWSAAPMTPQTAAPGAPIITTSPPPVGASFYPTPPPTQYSPPAFAGADDCAAAAVSHHQSWVGQTSSPDPLVQDQRHLSTGAMSMQPFVAMPPAYVVNEFGIGSTAAWDTLPGGSLNARFS